MRRNLLGASVLVVATLALALAQAPKVGPDQRYVFLIGENTSRLRIALEVTGALGFDVLFAAGRGVLLRRTAPTPHAYKLIAADRAATLEKELNEAAAQGFVVVRNAMTEFSDRTDPNDETLVHVITRRAADTSGWRSYRIAQSDDSFDRRLTDLAKEGFLSIGAFRIQRSTTEALLLQGPGRLHAILEGPADKGAGASASERPSRLLSAMKQSTLEKEVNEAAAQGFRVTAASLMNVILERSDSASVTYTYRFVAARRYSTLASEIAQAGREGYRLVPAAVMSTPGAAVLLERSSAGSAPVEYAFIAADVPPLDHIIAAFERSGFHPVALLVHQIKTYAVIMEKG